MAAKSLDLSLEQGKTFNYVVRWETLPIVYKAITGITQAAPAAVTAPSHNIPDGWRVAPVSVKGMSQINATHTPPSNSDFHAATVRDANTIELNDVNAAGFSAYASGGYLQFFTPVDLTGFTARMMIKDRIGGSILLSIFSPTGIIIDNVGKTITLNIDAVTSAAFQWVSGVYDLELVSATGVVSALLSGAVSVSKEITT